MIPYPQYLVVKIKRIFITEKIKISHKCLEYNLKESQESSGESGESSNEYIPESEDNESEEEEHEREVETMKVAMPKGR